VEYAGMPTCTNVPVGRVRTEFGKERCPHRTFQERTT